MLEHACTCTCTLQEMRKFSQATMYMQIHRRVETYLNRWGWQFSQCSLLTKTVFCKISSSKWLVNNKKQGNEFVSSKYLGEKYDLYLKIRQVYIYYFLLCKSWFSTQCSMTENFQVEKVTNNRGPEDWWQSSQKTLTIDVCVIELHVMTVKRPIRPIFAIKIPLDRRAVWALEPLKRVAFSPFNEGSESMAKPAQIASEIH